MRLFGCITPGMILSALFSGAVAVAAFVLLAQDGLLHRATGLDFHYLRSWVALAAILFLLGQIAEMAREVLVSRGVPLPPDPGGEDESEQSQGPAGAVPSSARVAAVLKSVLGECGRLALVIGAMVAIPQLPAIVSDRPGWPNVESIAPYLQSLNSLAVWTAVFSVFLIAVRGASEIWPTVARALPLPLGRFSVFALSYFLLSGGGVFSEAFGYSGSVPLAVITVVLVFPYLASALRQFASLDIPRSTKLPLQILLLVVDCGWIALILGAMVTLPRVIDGLSQGQYGGAFELVAKYLEILDSLALWSIILLSPFILIRAIAVFRPAIGEVFGFPVGRIILFALAVFSFSDKGIPATASAFPIPNLMPATSMVLAVSYVSLLLRRATLLGLSGRTGQLVTNIPPLVSAFVRALGISLVAWAVMDSLPLLSAPLLDRAATASLGESTLPYFAELFEVRFIFSGFLFVAILILSLPDPLWSPSRWHARPLVMAVGLAASGCLIWISGATLSQLGHGFPLAGTVAGVGLLSLALSELAAYGVDSNNPVLAGAARGMQGSRIRWFMVGASLAFYGVFLRPLMYETLWFARVYEWLAVLVLALWAMMQARGNLRPYVETTEAASAAWNEWDRHQQLFDNRPDSRWDLLERWRQRFVYHEEWTNMWAYLTGLMCRNAAPPESARAIIRPLLQSVGPGARRSFWRGGRKREQRIREMAFAQSIASIDRSLSNRPGPSLASRDSALSDLAGPYIEIGAEPETVAAAVIEAYARSGSDVNHVVNLWFPLVNPVERPSRWFEPPWIRNRRRSRARERRKKLMDAATAHLSGQLDYPSLPVAVAANSAPLYYASTRQSQVDPTPRTAMSSDNEVPEGAEPTTRNTGADGNQDRVASRRMRDRLSRVSYETAASAAAETRAGSLAIGEGVEILMEMERVYLVRTAGGGEAQVLKSQFRRLPILPGDDVEATE